MVYLQAPHALPTGMGVDSSSACPFLSSLQSEQIERPHPLQRDFNSLSSPDLLSGAALSPEAPSTSSSRLQQWEWKRPVLDGCPKLKRRQLRSQDRVWTLREVAQHKYRDDAWIAVDGKVYDITEHIVDHPGWDTGCGVSTILSILAHAGTECTQEFYDIHRSYPIAFKQLRAYYIGELAQR